MKIDRTISDLCRTAALTVCLSLLLSGSLIGAFAETEEYQDKGEGLYWPVPGHELVSQGLHGGGAIDISDLAICGATVIAAEGGVIDRMYFCDETHPGSYGDCHGLGTALVIRGNDGRYYTYAHLKSDSIPAGFAVGTAVHAGQTIGAVGDTGNATGPHLHFGITADPRYWNPVGIDTEWLYYVRVQPVRTLFSGVGKGPHKEPVLFAVLSSDCCDGAGFLVGTDPDSMVRCPVDGNGAGSRTLRLSLSAAVGEPVPGTVYYFRAYATVKDVEFCGETAAYTVPSVPVPKTVRDCAAAWLLQHAPSIRRMISELSAVFIPRLPLLPAVLSPVGDKSGHTS